MARYNLALDLFVYKCFAVNSNHKHLMPVKMYISSNILSIQKSFQKRGQLAMFLKRRRFPSRSIQNMGPIYIEIFLNNTNWILLTLNFNFLYYVILENTFTLCDIKINSRWSSHSLSHHKY